MSDGNPTNEQILAQQLKQATEQLQQMQQMQQAQVPPGIMPVATMQPGVAQQPMGIMPVSQMANCQPIGVSLQISIQTQQGKLRGHVHFGPEMATQQALMNALPQIMQMWPLDFWRPKQNNWGGGGSNRGGW